MNLQSALSQVSVLRVAARPKNIQIYRRRIPIVMFGGSPQPVKIRHVFPNLGSANSKPPLSSKLAARIF